MVMAVDRSYAAASNEFDRALYILYDMENGADQLLQDHIGGGGENVELNDFALTFQYSIVKN